MERARIETPLQRILQAEGRTQAWLARTLEVDGRQVWVWVHGLHVPEPDTRGAIAQALGRTVQELWPEAVDPDKAAA